jgi:hypothetical protein
MWIGNGEYQRALVELFGLGSGRSRDVAVNAGAVPAAGGGRSVNPGRGLGVSSISVREVE